MSTGIWVWSSDATKVFGGMHLAIPALEGRNRQIPEAQQTDRQTDRQPSCQTPGHLIKVDRTDWWCLRCNAQVCLLIATHMRTYITWATTTRVHTHTYTCTYTNSRAHTHAHTRVSTHMNSRARTQKCMHTRAHTWTRACTHKCMHARAHTRMHTQAHTNSHEYTHMRTYLHTHAHMDIHAHTHNQDPLYESFCSFIFLQCFLPPLSSFILSSSLEQSYAFLLLLSLSPQFSEQNQEDESFCVRVENKQALRWDGGEPWAAGGLDTTGGQEQAPWMSGCPWNLAWLARVLWPALVCSCDFLRARAQ